MPSNKIILQPVSSKDKLLHYLATVKAPVDRNRIKKHFEANLVIALYRDKQIHVWGNTHDAKGTNARKWEEIVPGDIMLFSGKGKFFASATVLSKIHSKNLSLDLWGEDKKGKTREYIYFLDDVRDQNITYADFNTVAGNTPDFIIRTFSVLDVKRSLLVFYAFNLKKDIIKDEELPELLETRDDTETHERQIDEEEPESNVGNAEAIAREWFLTACRYDRRNPCSDKATDAYIKCLRYDDKHIDAYMNLGLINLAKKDYDESLDCFQKIIELEPHNQEAIKNLSYVYKKMDDIALADQTVSRGNIEPVARHRFPKITILVIILALLILWGGYSINQDILQRLYNRFHHQKTTDIQETTPQKPPVKDIKFDFRNTRWGMTKEQVKASETMKIVYEKESVILYHGEVAGVETTVYYTFKKNMLLGCVQRFIEYHIDDNNYILDYKKAKDALTHKYGPPVTDEQLWSNDVYKDNPQDWGFAVRRGDLVFRSRWKFNYTEIGLGLNSNSLDNGIIHAVSYTIK